MVIPCNFYLLRPAIFAANQLVSEMEIITFESKAYKELDNKITAIADYIFNHTEAESTNEDEIWVDSYEVCTFLKIRDSHLFQYQGTLFLQDWRNKTIIGRTPD